MRKFIRNLILPVLFPMLGCGVANARHDADRENTSLETTGNMTYVESRPVTGYYSLEIGRKSVLATYLSPLKYHGTSYTLSGEWSKAMPFNPRNAIMHFDGKVCFDNLSNPAGTARMIGLNAGFKWGISWRNVFPNGVQVTAGGSVDIDGGAYYLLRNGNNPVQAMATVAISARLSASRPFRIGAIDFLIADKVSVPSLSVFFSPEYGETYYEIYLGNHKNLVHAAWPGNYFGLNNLLSLDLRFGRTTLRLGYRCNILSTKVSEIVTRRIEHTVVVGIVCEWLSLGPKSVSPSDTRIINALY